MWPILSSNAPRAQERTRGAWRMAAIGVSEDEARELLAPYRGAIHIAAVNAPTQVTLAGEAAVVEELAATLTERGRFARVLPLPYAFHSPAMDVVRDDFLSVVSHVVARAATVPYLSTVTGGELPGEALGPDYWWRNLRQPVQFAAAVRTALGRGHRTFLEIGPSASLVRYIDEILAAEHVAGAAIGSLKRDAPAMQCVLGSVAKLHVRGVAVQWEQLRRGCITSTVPHLSVATATLLGRVPGRACAALERPLAPPARNAQARRESGVAVRYRTAHARLSRRSPPGRPRGIPRRGLCGADAVGRRTGLEGIRTRALRRSF